MTNEKLKQKIAVIGAGCVGSTTAYSLVVKNLASGMKFREHPLLPKDTHPVQVVSPKGLIICPPCLYRVVTP